MFTTSRTITATTTVLLFCFQGQLWWRFTSTKIFLENASSKAFIQRCSLMKYVTSISRFSFKTTVLNIFGKFPENISDRAHIQHSYALCSTWFSRNFPDIFRTASGHFQNKAGGALLISSDYSLKISRTPFNSLTPGDNKQYTYLSKPSTKTSRFV